MYSETLPRVERKSTPIFSSGNFSRSLRIDTGWLDGV